MNRQQYDALYYAALDADKAFVQALRAQFGQRQASCMRFSPNAFNEATGAAYKAKVADETWLKAMKAFDTIVFEEQSNAQ